MRIKRTEELQNTYYPDHMLWVPVQDVTRLCLSKMTEKPTKYLQGDWNNSLKLIIEELEGGPE